MAYPSVDKGEFSPRVAGVLAGVGAYPVGRAAGFLASVNSPGKWKVLPKSLGLLSGAGAYSATTYKLRKKRDSLKKKAEDTDWKNDQKFLGGLAAGGAGGTLLANAYHSGDLTGRATLYHGTRSDAMARSIREHGLKQSTEKSMNSSSSEQLKARSGRVYEDSLGKSYMAKDFGTANGYAGGNKRNVIKLNVPLWKYKQVVNPEVAMDYKAFSHDLDRIANSARKMNRLETPGKGIKFLTDLVKTWSYDNLRDAVVVEGDVAPKYIKGSSKYTKNSLGEIKEYIKARPKQFLQGLGKAGLGLGLLGGGGLLLRNSLATKSK